MSDGATVCIVGVSQTVAVTAYCSCKPAVIEITEIGSGISVGVGIALKRAENLINFYVLLSL